MVERKAEGAKGALNPHHKKGGHAISPSLGGLLPCNVEDRCIAERMIEVTVAPRLY